MHNNKKKYMPKEIRMRYDPTEKNKTTKHFSREINYDAMLMLVNTVVQLLCWQGRNERVEIA